jgi:murein DD-endopeptidase MepM/ murein hydrolase activator NlpD
MECIESTSIRPRMRRPRSTFALPLAVLLAASLLAQPVALAQDPVSKLEAIQDRIQRTEAQLKRAEKREDSLLGQIDRSDQRRAGLNSMVLSLEDQLSVAEGRLAVVQAELERKEQRLAYLQLRLQVTTRILRGQIDTLRERADIAYRYGPGGFLSVLLGSDTLGEFIDRQEFVSEALANDSEIVDEIRQTREQVDTQRGQVESQRDQIEDQRDRVRAEVDRIDGIRAQQQFLLDQVENELAIRRDALSDIRASKAEYKKALRELQAESERIEDLLQSQGSTGSGHFGGELFWPTAGGIASGFGPRFHPILNYTRMHYGVDIGGACGQPIWAADEGVVISAGYNGGFGYATVIDHGQGLATLYAHQTTIQVGYGESVRRGEQIGLVGSTGLSTSCHLHFEVRVNGTPVDPVPYLT